MITPGFQVFLWMLSLAMAIGGTYLVVNTNEHRARRKLERAIFEPSPAEWSLLQATKIVIEARESTVYVECHGIWVGSGRHWFNPEGTRASRAFADWLDGIVRSRSHRDLTSAERKVG